MMEFDDAYTPSGDLVVSGADRNWFLSDLAKQYHRAPIRIQSEGPISGEVRHCRLSHISSDVAGIVFEMECDYDSETRYAVANPQRVIAHRNSNGQTEGLTIVSLDGSVTRAWFGDAAMDASELGEVAA